MKTPILDMLRKYAEADTLRLHMPGHKGALDKTDITEIEGADSLYDASGIIKESEGCAGELFGADTFYSAEGSSLSIRAMLYLACLYARAEGKAPLILAGRNAHKVFISTAALLDLEVEWLAPSGSSYLSCPITGRDVEEYIKKTGRQPTAVYLTSPDYLGNTVDIKKISEVCHKYGALLLLDNAHGAYLKFLEKSRHPIDLGADMCCDSAHKTLPALTGSAYLHIRKGVDKLFKERAKEAMALFGSTSPSYPILASLDGVNRYICDGYSQRMSAFIYKVDALKKKIKELGYTLAGDEPLKITLETKSYGYLGFEVLEALARRNIICEFADPDFLVMMLTPDMSDENIERLFSALCDLPKKPAIEKSPPKFTLPEKVISPREAMFAEREVFPTSECLGRILGAVTVGCPPAVPIIVSGERIDEAAINAALYYGINNLKVIK